MTDELSYLSAADLVAAYRAKRLSPVEATRAALDRIDRLDGRINAFCLVDADGALAAARESEARWMKGEPLGIVDGVPSTIKDLLLTRGWPTLRGSRLVPKDQEWSEDAPATARLRESGAVLLGKTTMPEFGWKAVGDSPLTGITRNPYDLDRTPGGSSAGAAAALAAGMGALAVGTDAGGSIRIPCSFCGLPGIKATFGRVPAYPPSAMGTLSHVGPMARTVRDVALMLTVLSATDARDPHALPWEAIDYRTDLESGVKGMRIAYSPTLGYAHVDPEVAEAVDRAAKAFAAMGAHVELADPGFASPRDAMNVLWQSGAAKLLSAYSEEQRAVLVDPGLNAAARAGARFSAIDYVAADAVRTQLGLVMSLFHERYELLLTPTVAVPALPVGADLSNPSREEQWIDWTPFSYPFNMTRQPAATVPCGFTKSGLPIGLQIVGRLYDEALVLRAARAYERESGHAFVAPQGFR